ncbi:hypothetical protein D3C73_755770 [compost metagenome]
MSVTYLWIANPSTVRYTFHLLFGMNIVSDQARWRDQNPLGMIVPQLPSESNTGRLIPQWRYYGPHAGLDVLCVMTHYPVMADHQRLRTQYAYIRVISAAA